MPMHLLRREPCVALSMVRPAVTAYLAARVRWRMQKMDINCCMYVQTNDGFLERKPYECFGVMKHEAYINQKNYRVLYWWCMLDEFDGGAFHAP